GKKVVLWDFGAKANIRRELLKRGLEVIVMDASATADEILAQKPDGLMLSNGPGDPGDNVRIIEEIRKLIQAGLPLFGICLGHQMLALAAGAKTSKLKYGHRGANQPVKQLSTGRVYISSQNHGYAVENDSLPEGAVLSFVNTNDGTCEGITYTTMPAFSVQFHPEACSGPLDTSFLFDEFVRLINDHGYFRRFKADYQRIDSISYFAGTIAGTKARMGA
ncbi:MAG: carbamoyl phosphate synthase small subunit, partial [Treponema sp.]|nr:carbamoyl phosphate synthase small subunit [Treponema sp.]